MKKILSSIATLLVVAALGGGAWWYWNQKTNVSAEYRTARVEFGDVMQKVTATGTLNPVTTVDVSSQISGQIQKLFVDFNSQVKQGEIIAQLDAATYQANVAQAEGEIANAKANLELTKPIRERAEALFSKGMASQATLDQAVANFRQAEASVQIKQATLSKAKVDLERCTIYSPIDGIVISRDVDVGQTVAASLSAPTLFVIANDLSKMQINASVAEADIGNVKENQEVIFSVDAFPEEKFKGTVSQVRNAATTVQNVVTYDVIISVDNPELKLKPGMTANVSIITAKKENVLLIPNSALRFSPSNASQESGGNGKRKRSADAADQKTVYLLNSDGSWRKVVAQIGISDGAYTEVVTGLQENESVIIGETTTTKKQSEASAQNPFTGGGPPGERRMRRL
ncbi:MAG: efflux RND transporter periplasmic adaptor subunit [Verrucomicrobiota bacterium]